jgi:hypothetical protein
MATTKRNTTSKIKDKNKPNTKIDATTECNGITASAFPPFLNQSSKKRITTAIIKQQLQIKTILENVRMKKVTGLWVTSYGFGSYGLRVCKLHLLVLQIMARKVYKGFSSLKNFQP